MSADRGVVGVPGGGDPAQGAFRVAVDPPAGVVAQVVMAWAAGQHVAFLGAPTGVRAGTTPGSTNPANNRCCTASAHARTRPTSPSASTRTACDNTTTSTTGNVTDAEPTAMSTQNPEEGVRQKPPSEATIHAAMSNRTMPWPDVPPVRNHSSGLLTVDDIPRIYWERSGDPGGIPAVYLPGGPGSGLVPVAIEQSSIRCAVARSDSSNAAAAGRRRMPPSSGTT